MDISHSIFSFSLIDILAYTSIGWFIVNFTPIQKILDYTTALLITNNPKYFLLTILPLSIRKILSCSKCTSFWLTLILTQDIYLSASASLLAFIISNNLSSIKL